MNELPKQEEDALRTWLQQAREPEISHDELVAYLRCQTNNELTQKIESVKTGNANIRLLFDLIDQERDKAKVKASQPKGLNYPRIPHKVEALLQQITAGQSSRKDAQQFIDGLTFSPLFYRQVLRRIAVALAESEGDEEIEKLPATVRNEILRTVLSDVKRGNQGGFLAVTSRTASDIWQDIRRLPDLIVSPKAGFMAAAAMVVFVSLFEVRYYQTTYKLNRG